MTIDRHSAEVIFGEPQPKVALAGQLFETENRFGGDFGTDPVAGQDSDVDHAACSFGLDELRRFLTASALLAASM